MPWRFNGTLRPGEAYPGHARNLRTRAIRAHLFRQIRAGLSEVEWRIFWTHWRELHGPLIQTGAGVRRWEYTRDELRYLIWWLRYVRDKRNRGFQTPVVASDPQRLREAFDTLYAQVERLTGEARRLALRELESLEDRLRLAPPVELEKTA